MDKEKKVPVKIVPAEPEVVPLEEVAVAPPERETTRQRQERLAAEAAAKKAEEEKAEAEAAALAAKYMEAGKQRLADALAAEAAAKVAAEAAYEAAEVVKREAQEAEKTVTKAEKIETGAAEKAKEVMTTEAYQEYEAAREVTKEAEKKVKEAKVTEKTVVEEYEEAKITQTEAKKAVQVAEEAVKEVPVAPPKVVIIPPVKERETPRQRRERRVAERAEVTVKRRAAELDRAERVREQRIEAARLVTVKKAAALELATQEAAEREARQVRAAAAERGMAQARQRIEAEMTHPSPEVVVANVESRKDLSTENLGKFESTIVTFGQTLDTAKSDKADMMTEYNQRKSEYQAVIRDQNKYTADSIRDYKESYEQYEDIYNSNLKAYDEYILGLEVAIRTSQSNIGIEETNIENMNRWIADQTRSTSPIIRGSVRSDMSIAERQLDAELMDEMATTVTDLRKQVDTSSTRVYPKPKEEIDPGLVTHMGITMTRSQFEADFPPGTIPDSVVAGRPVIKPVDIGKAYEGAFQSVTDPMRDFAKNLSTKAVALAPTQPLVGLATYFAGTAARFAVGVVEGATFFVRPAAWGRTAEAIGLLLRPEKSETYEEYRAKISNFVADDIADPTLRAQVETQLLASIPYQALSQEDIDQGIAFRQAAGTAITADPVGFAAEVVGGIVGGYLLGKGVEAGLKKAGVIKPKVAPEQIIETQDELAAWVESIKVPKEPGVSVAPSQWQPYGGEKVPSAFEQAKVFSDMGFTAQDVAGLVPDEVIKAIDDLAKATPYQQAVALDKMGFGVKDVTGIAPDEVVRAFKDYVASSPYQQAKALFDKGFGVKDVAGTVPDEVVKIIDDLAKASPYQQAKALQDLGFDIGKAPKKPPSDVVKAFDDMKVAPPYQQAKALYDLGFGPKDVKGVVADDVLTALTDMKVAPAYQQAVAIDYFQKLIKSGMPYEEAARTMDVMMKGGTAVVQLQSGAVITYRPTLLYTGTGLPEVGSLVGAVVVATGIEPGIEMPPEVPPMPPVKLTQAVVTDALKVLDVDTVVGIVPKLIETLDGATRVDVIQNLTSNQIKKLPVLVIPDILPDLTPAQVKDLDEDQIKIIPPIFIPDILPDLTPNQITDLTTDQIQKILPEVIPDVIQLLTPDQIQGLDEDQIVVIPPIVIPDIISDLTDDQLQYIPPIIIPDIILRLDVPQLQKLASRLRRALEPRQLQKIISQLPPRLRTKFRKALGIKPRKIPPSKDPEPYRIKFQYHTSASETKHVRAKTFHEALIVAEGQRQITLDPVEVEVEKLELRR